MKRNFGLDVIRALSIWLVLFQHAGINIHGLHPLEIGMIGVEIFFVLSGFLIGGIIFKEIDKGNGFFTTLKSFWVRRWLRILPLYYAVIILKFIFIDHSMGWNILYYIFFLQNNFYGIHFLPVSWSLVIEEWFYLTSPIFLFIVTKYAKKDAQVFYSMLGFILFIIIIRTLYVFHGNVPYAGINGNFPFRFDSLFIGVLLSFTFYKKWKLFDVLATPKVCIAGLLIFFGYIYYFWTLAYPTYLIDTVYLPRTLGFFILPMSIGMIIPLASKWQYNYKRITGKLIYRFITWTSVLTYGIYLIHMFVYSKVMSVIPIHSFYLHLAVAIAITYFLAWLTYNYFERPILNYRDKITGQARVKMK